jgi:spermidine synthase
LPDLRAAHSIEFETAVAAITAKGNSVLSSMTPPSAPAAGRNWANLAIVCLCFVLSGVAALIYQTAWTRQFALVFGTSELAIAAVLAAYMGGLALGAWLIEQRIQHVTRPVLWYASLELGIGASALLLVPAGLWLAEHLLGAVLGGQSAPPSAHLGGTTLFYLVAAFVILMIPTTLMGATLPLLARHAVHSEQQIGRRIGLLYACNTAGAVGGALLGALVLLPKVGLSKTVWVAAAINLLVGILASLLGKHSPATQDTPVTEIPSEEKLHAGAAATWVLPLMMLSGAISFLHEVLWTRMLGHVTGSSIYSFGIMVASFLAGIALGGGLGAWLAKRRETAARWLAISELAAALAALGAWLAIQTVSNRIDSLTQRLTFGFELLFPLAFAIGLTYPLAVRILARNVGDAARASARVYSWNTIGAIVGSIAGGFFIVPSLKYEGAVQLAVISSCVLAIAATFVLFKPSKWFAIPITLSAIAVASIFNPQPPEALLRYSPLRVNGQGEMLFYGVGRSAAVVTLRQGEQIAVRTNGLPEASVDTKGSLPQRYVEAWMAPLAVLARPQATDMLIVGLGGGRVLEAVPPAIKNIDVIELEDKVVAANRNMAARRAYDPLADPRVNMVINDARGALHLTDKKYDVVVSQPSHPWTAGASHLYTREYMQQAKDHLKPGGVFVQWMNIDFLDESLLRSLVATVRDVYPHVHVYRPAPPTLLFLASDEPIEPERTVDATRRALAASPDFYARLGINAVEDMIAYWVLDDDTSRSFSSGSAVITDDHNRFATESVYDFGRNIGAETLGRLLQPYDPLMNANSFLYQSEAAQFNWPYVLRDIGLFASWDGSARERLNQLANLYRKTELQPYAQALILQYSQQVSQAQQLRYAATQAFPNSVLLRDSVLEPWTPTLGYDTAPADVTKLVAKASPIGQMVIQAAHYAAKQDWDNLAKMDDSLAQVPWISQWFAQASQLRAEWRVRVSNPNLRTNFSSQAVAMIDRVSLNQVVPQMLILRAVAGFGINSPQTSLESISKYASLVVQNQNFLNDSSRASFGGGLQTLRPMLAKLQSDASLDKARLTEVQNLFAQASSLVGLQ